MNYYNLISIMPKAPAYDADAQAFITATGISGTNATATNQLVLDLKAANIWTKMKAVYPMVGGTATAHKFNLKNPLDTDAAFRLVFNGGWTHSANGALPNGSNAYADTKLIPNSNLTSNNHHLSFYSRTNNTTTAYELACQSIQASSTQYGYMLLSTYNSGTSYYQQQTQNTNAITITESNSLGFYLGSRTSSTLFKGYKNNILRGTNTNTASVIGSYQPINSIYLSAFNANVNGSISTSNYSNRECAFASIGDGLTDLESQLFYQITEKYQVALGRNINPTQSFYYNSAYNNETNAFLFSTQITDNTIQTATNTLVNDLKAANIWTKMKAIYPMVGGTATAHKFNLKNPADTDAAFRLSFIGGGTHSANGYLPNGTNSFANTFLIPSTALSTMSQHISYYSRTNNTSAAILDNGCQDDVFPSIGRNIYAQYYNSLTLSRVQIQSLDANAVPFAETNSLGFILGSRTSATSFKAYRNNLLKGTNTTNSTSGLCGNSVYIGGFNYRNNFGTTIYYGIRQCAFASIGDGLSDAEALTLYNAVQTFQTTLGRQV